MHEALKIDLKQILGFIATEGITPSSLSPFYSEEPSVNKAPKLAAESIPLVRVVCDPAASVNARIVSAEGVVATRLYADHSGQMMVRHWLDKDGLHHFRQIHEKDIADEAVLRLMLDIPPSRLEFDTEMTEGAFCALLGLIDCWREKTLLSLIDRKPGGRFFFKTEEMYTAFRRSVSSSDLRWLTPLLKELYPGNLDVSPAVFEEGVRSIIPKFIESATRGMHLTLLGEELCSSLSAPLAAFKMSVCGIENGVIWEENMIGLRGMGIYCTVETDETNDGKIILKNSSAPMIEFDLHSKLVKALKMSRQSEEEKAVRGSVGAVLPPSPEPAMTSDQKTAKNFCSECGMRLKPGAKFCAGCGKKI